MAPEDDLAAAFDQLAKSHPDLRLEWDEGRSTSWLVNGEDVRDWVRELAARAVRFVSPGSHSDDPMSWGRLILAIEPDRVRVESTPEGTARHVVPEFASASASVIRSVLAADAPTLLGRLRYLCQEVIARIEDTPDLSDFSRLSDEIRTTATLLGLDPPVRESWGQVTGVGVTHDLRLTDPPIDDQPQAGVTLTRWHDEKGRDVTERLTGRAIEEDRGEIVRRMERWVRWLGNALPAVKPPITPDSDRIPALAPLGPEALLTQGMGALLRHLADKDEGVAVADLPDSLREPDLLTVCDADGLIEFGRRCHCWAGGSELRIESGWDFTSITGPNKKPMRTFLEEEIPGEDERIRTHVGLTPKGRIEAARLRLTASTNPAGNDDLTDPSERPTVNDLCSVAGISDDTFRRVRKQAGIEIEEKGSAARSRRYTPAEMDRLIAAALAGTFIERRRMAEKWARWGDQSRK